MAASTENPSICSPDELFQMATEPSHPAVASLSPSRESALAVIALAYP